MIKVCQFSPRLNGHPATIVRHHIIKEGPSAGRDLFHCEVNMGDEGTLYTSFFRCNLTDDSQGVEINNRIAELERLAEGGV